MLTSVLRSLDDGDVNPLRGHLAQAGVDVEAVRALPQWNTTAPVDTLRRSIGVLAGTPYGVALLLIYILSVCEATWEESYHYRPIWTALDDGYEWHRHAPDLPEDERPATAAVAALLRLLHLEIEVENAMTTGILGGFGEAADRTVDFAGQAEVLAEAASGASPELADFVRQRARATRWYYEGARAAGQSLVRFLAEPGARLTGAIDRLRDIEQAESALETNRVSELRAHRFSLIELDSRAGREWLHVDGGKIIYIYPFAVAGRPGDVTALAAAEGEGWRIAGVTPNAVHASYMSNDVWDGTDLFGRTYDGTMIELPRIRIADLSNVELGTLTAEIRLSTIGNHYVRLEAELIDAGPQDVYAAMFRAAPEHGIARVTVDGADAEWARLSDFAQDMAGAVAALVERGFAGHRGSDRDASLARRGTYHVIVVVDAASVSTGPAGPRREVRSRDEVMDAVGVQALLNPVTHCVSSLAEWCRYPAAATPNILASVTHREDMVIRTANTTVFVALGSPSFHTGTRVTVAEFVASLDGLFAGWIAELTIHYREVTELLGDSDATQLAGRSSGEWAERLRQKEWQLRDFVTVVRSTVALIESPDLVASPVVSAMKARLLDEAGFRQRAVELDRQVEEVLGNRLVGRIGETVRALEERRERRQRARMDTALAVIAAVGISGLGQIIQSGYDVRALGAVWITATIIGLAALFGLVVRLANRGHEPRPSGSAAPPGNEVAPSVTVPRSRVSTSESLSDGAAAKRVAP